jgi:hypothetical protein
MSAGLCSGPSHRQRQRFSTEETAARGDWLAQLSPNGSSAANAADFAKELLTTWLKLTTDPCCRSQMICLSAPKLREVQLCSREVQHADQSRMAVMANDKKKFRSSLGGLGLFIGLGIVASQITVWFLLGVWNPISIATVLDTLLVALEDVRPMESFIGLQNTIDGTSFFGLPASVAFAVIGVLVAVPIRTTEATGNERRRMRPRLG